MAWQNPKTNWQAADVVSKDDFNRIEGNVQELQNTKETPAGAQAKAEAAAGAVQAALDAHLAEIVTTPQANKILRLDANAKLPTSITGDAATVAGKSVGNGSGQVPVSNGTVCTNLNADKVDSIHFQISGGILQYNDGTGWKNVSNIVTVQRGATSVGNQATVNVTIGAVDLSKSFLVADTGFAYTGSSESVRQIKGQLVNSTTIQFVSTGKFLSQTISWEVIQIA